MASTTEELYKWQTLIGSGLGPFLAIILSGLGYLLKSKYESIQLKKEHLRQLEITVARMLNDLYVLKDQLTWFSNRLKKLSREAIQENGAKVFFLNAVNFPSLREIYRDQNMPNFRVRSYYLHNKILWIDAGIKAVNETNVALGNDFKELMRRNELLVSLLKTSTVAGPSIQRIEYSENLKAFASGLDEYITETIRPGIKALTEARVYNSKIRKPDGFWEKWKYEGTSFKFFATHEQMRKHTGSLYSIERIDKQIEKSVTREIFDAEKRSEELRGKTRN